MPVAEKGHEPARDAAYRALSEFKRDFEDNKITAAKFNAHIYVGAIELLLSHREEEG